MPFNPTAQPILQADIDAIKTAINGIITQINTANTTNVALTKDERSKGVTVGEKREPFNDYYYENKNDHPEFKPAANQTSITEAQADQHFFNHNGMGSVIDLLTSAIELAQDIQLNSEHFAYEYASDGRLVAKTAAEKGKPGADAWFDALDSRFPQRGPEVTEAP
jgi:hypothetical protein